MARQLVACVLFGGTLLGCSSESTGPADSAGTTVVPSTVEDPAELADAVEVLDAGFTAGEAMGCVGRDGEVRWSSSRTNYSLPDYCPADRRPSLPQSRFRDAVSYGVVIENTSDLVLIDVPVTHRFLDAEGRVVRASEADPHPPDVGPEVIPVLRPHEPLGFGGMRLVDRPGTAEIEVEIGEPEDWEPEVRDEEQRAAQGERGELAVTRVDLEPGGWDEPVVTFSVESRYPSEQTLYTVDAIFYDVDGQVLGGADDVGVPENVLADLIVPPGGSADGVVALDSPMLIPGIDPDLTEIHVPQSLVIRR